MVGVEVTDHGAAIRALEALLPECDGYRDWPQSDVERCLWPPINYDQYLVMFEAGAPVGFLTWAWFSPVAEAGLLDGSRLLRPRDFPRTSPDDTLWIADLLAPHGHVVQLCRAAQRVLSPLCDEHGLRGAKMRRGTRRQGFFPARRIEG